MAADWYVLHTYSGYENKIEKSIKTMIENGELDKSIVLEVKIPCEEVSEVKDGKKKTRSKKFLPGYILVYMDFPDADTSWKQTCAQIKKIQGVSGFVCTPADKKPLPLKDHEARAILEKSGEIKSERPVRQSYAQGEHVKIVAGPFESFTGTIEEVNHEKNKLKVMVGIFGRNTPVEVDINQVEKQ